MSRVFLDLGFIKIYWYSVCIVAGMILGSFLITKEAKKKNVSTDEMTNIIFGALMCGIVGARIYYVLFNFNEYKTNLLEVFAVWNGGLAIHGGLLFGILYIFCYTRRKKNLSFFEILDLCAPGVLIGQILGRWGNFFNKEAFGPICSLSFLKKIHMPNFIIDGMYIDGNYHHPTFLYESFWNLIGLVIILLYRKKKNLKIGEVTGIYLMWYSLGRFFIEILREDSLMFLNIKVAMLVSIILFILGLFLFIYSHIKWKKYGE